MQIQKTMEVLVLFVCSMFSNLKQLRSFLKSIGFYLNTFMIKLRQPVSILFHLRTGDIVFLCLPYLIVDVLLIYGIMETVGYFQKPWKLFRFIRKLGSIQGSGFIKPVEYFTLTGKPVSIVIIKTTHISNSKNVLLLKIYIIVRNYDTIQSEL